MTTRKIETTKSPSYKNVGTSNLITLEKAPNLMIMAFGRLRHRVVPFKKTTCAFDKLRHQSLRMFDFYINLSEKKSFVYIEKLLTHVWRIGVPEPVEGTLIIMVMSAPVPEPAEGINFMDKVVGIKYGLWSI